MPQERRALANAIINSGSAIGMGIGLIGSSILVKSMHMAWQNVLFIVAAILVVMLCVFTTVIRRKLKEPAVAENKLAQRLPLRSLKRNRRRCFRRCCAASTFSISAPATATT